MRLRAEEARVLGTLVEKQFTTPQQYPLTLTALVAACNQTTNRDPVVVYDETTVLAAIDDLKRQRLARAVLPSHGRSVVRYRHVLDETLALDRRQCALVAVLLLRGPQTLGELRIRTDRMADFDGLEGVMSELGSLASREEGLASNLGRGPGQKEERWSCPLVGPVAGIDLPSAAEGPEQADGVEAVPLDVGTALAILRSEVSELRDELRALQERLGD
ncbi:MAG TPA: YceH family protein [Acidimicrobiales bacterium]|nr:YceH family protein [Acidimicrobiales bacterium]